MGAEGHVHLIGDEVTALGFRLAGVTVHTPLPEDVATTFERVRNFARVILITAGFAERLPEDVREAAFSANSVLTLVIPDIRGEHTVADRGARWRRVLGVGS